MEWKSTEKKPIVKKPEKKIERMLDDLLESFTKARKVIKEIKK